MSLADTCLARFVPLPHQLQEASTFLTRNPSQAIAEPQPTIEPQPITEPQTGAYDCKLCIYYLPNLF